MSRTMEIVAEVERRGSTRESIAAVYRKVITRPTRDFVDWPTVNRAILARYRPSGLRYIKRLAWKP